MVDPTDNDARDANSAGDAASEGEGKFVPPKDGSWVPRDKLNKVLERLHRAEGQVAALSKAPAASGANMPATRPRPKSRAELMADVEAGKLTRPDAETIWERQVVQRATESAVAHVAQTTQANVVQARLADYEERFPDLKDPESDLFKAATGELAGMLNMGLPDALSTTLVAVEKALGPLAKARAPRHTGEANRDGGASGYDGAARKPGQAMKWSELSERQQSYYDRCIEQGQFADRAAVCKTLTKFPPKARVVLR